MYCIVCIFSSLKNKNKELTELTKLKTINYYSSIFIQHVIFEFAIKTTWWK